MNSQEGSFILRLPTQFPLAPLPQPLMFECRLLITTALMVLLTRAGLTEERFEFRGRIVDADTDELIPARVYLSDQRGNHFQVKSANRKGKAIPYRVDRGQSREIHTTVSENVFSVQLTPGKYQLTAEHGKEYLPRQISFTISNSPLQETIRLKRWSHVRKQGWYSGDVHLHRKIAELPLVMKAEDLNVALPLTYWVTDSESRPGNDNKSGEKPLPARVIEVSPQHLIWPINTEYEIFTVKGKQHTLGAFFVLGHSRELDLKAPPTGPILEESRKQHALIDMDKHNWPWSMMIAHRMKVDLFELSNNHVWRTPFLFKDWYPEYAGQYMEVEKDKSGGFTARGWLDFGFENYYSLLNCGLRIMPSGGTASGVHPVPAGFGRVYVHLPEGLGFRSWMQGLKQGRSFVTNGPMLDVRVNDCYPGHEFKIDSSTEFRLTATATYPTDYPTRFECIVNGEVVKNAPIQSIRKSPSILRLKLEKKIEFESSSWMAVRCTQKMPNGNISFAHSAPFFFMKQNEPIRPRKVEAQYLLERVENEIRRHQQVLTPEQLEEYHAARKFYREQLKVAR